MLRQIALGISVSLVNFAIHAFLVSAVVVAARRAVRGAADSTSAGFPRRRVSTSSSKR